MNTLSAPGKSVTCTTITNRNPLNFHRRERVKSNETTLNHKNLASCFPALKVRIKIQNN